VNELQEARGQYLDALQANCDLERRYAELSARHFATERQLLEAVTVLRICQRQYALLVVSVAACTRPECRPAARSPGRRLLGWFARLIG